jgi:CMP-N,N'-diacetyllegionaminic acid synthase
MKILAIILARKNSKRLKNKHHLNLGGKSLIQHTFDLLKKKKIFSDIVVSTDDEKIIKNVKKKYSDFIPILRSKNLSRDSTESYQVLIEVYNWYYRKYSSVDGIFLFQPTSPFRKLTTVQKMIKEFKKNQMKRSVISVKKVKNHPEWMFEIKNNKMFKFQQKKNIQMSQYLKKLFIVNGLGYLLVPKDLIKQRTTIPNNSIPIVCNSEVESLDIDTREDLDTARAFKSYFKL